MTAEKMGSEKSHRLLHSWLLENNTVCSNMIGPDGRCQIKKTFRINRMSLFILVYVLKETQIFF